MNFCGIQPFGSFDDTGVVLNDKTELNGKIECNKHGQVLTAYMSKEWSKQQCCDPKQKRLKPQTDIDPKKFMLLKQSLMGKKSRAVP